MNTFGVKFRFFDITTYALMTYTSETSDNKDLLGTMEMKISKILGKTSTRLTKKRQTTELV